MQEANRFEKCCVNTDFILKLKNKDKSTAIYNKPNKINYFLLVPGQDNHRRVSAEIMQQLQRYFKDMFTGIGCFDGTLSLQIKPDSKLCQASPRHVAYVLLKPFTKELEQV